MGRRGSVARGTMRAEPNRWTRVPLITSRCVDEFDKMRRMDLTTLLETHAQSSAVSAPRCAPRCAVVTLQSNAAVWHLQRAFRPDPEALRPDHTSGLNGFTPVLLDSTTFSVSTQTAARLQRACIVCALMVLAFLQGEMYKRREQVSFRYKQQMESTDAVTCPSHMELKAFNSLRSRVAHARHPEARRMDCCSQSWFRGPSCCDAGAGC